MPAFLLHSELHLMISTLKSFQASSVLMLPLMSLIPDTIHLTLKGLFGTIHLDLLMNLLIILVVLVILLVLHPHLQVLVHLAGMVEEEGEEEEDLAELQINALAEGEGIQEGQDAKLLVTGMLQLTLQLFPFPLILLQLFRWLKLLIGMLFHLHVSMAFRLSGILVQQCLLPHPCLTLRVLSNLYLSSRDLKV